MAQEIKNSLLRLCFRWANPNYPTETVLSDADWRSQHDEISKTTWNLAWLLIASCLFCLITLGAPDAVLVNRDAKINIPFAGTTVSYTGFLFFGPLILVVLAMYLHVFVEQRLRIGRLKDRPLSPFLFNLGLPSAELLSAFVFYWMLPCVLMFFCWRALPRPEAPLLIFLTMAVTAFMVGLGIRRFGVQGPLTAAKRVILYVLWVILTICIILLVPLAHAAGQIVFGNQASGQRGQTVAVTSVSRSSILQPTRRLQLFGAALEKTNLIGLYAPYADMRKADLKEADLEGANLSHADMRKADLSKANLSGADLTGAQLQGAVITDATLRLADLHGAVIDNITVVDIKWMRVLCIVNHNLGRNCTDSPNWAWTDLRDTNLSQADLAGTDMTGVNLTGADLSGAELKGAVLRFADLRGATLPRSINEAITDGALTKAKKEAKSSSASKDEAIVVLANRGSESCLLAPDSPLDDTRPTMLKSHSCQSATGGHKWYASRLDKDDKGYVTFRGAISVKNTQNACLDATSATYEGAPVHMWHCGPDYDNQYWAVILATDGFVLLEKRDTGFCLNSTGQRNGGVVPQLSKCDSDNHNQHWRIQAQ
jgi:uncharacterized protein YjbI with pentapeptide repeats